MDSVQGSAMGWPWVCQSRDENKSPELWRQYKNLVHLDKLLLSGVQNDCFPFICLSYYFGSTK